MVVLIITGILGLLTGIQVGVLGCLIAAIRKDKKRR